MVAFSTLPVKSSNLYIVQFSEVPKWKKVIGNGVATSENLHSAVETNKWLHFIFSHLPRSHLLNHIFKVTVDFLLD
jgi:hypothetical protein